MDIKNKKILITGGLGFIGSNLAIKLTEMGAKVTVIDNLLETHGANFYNLEHLKDDINIVIANITNRPVIDHLIKTHQIIYHVASLSSNYESIKNPALTMDLNCYGTLNLLESVRANNPNIIFVHIGSRAQYGIVDQLPANEKTPMNPLAFYGMSKMVSEHYTRLYKKICNLKFIILRLTNTYGPRHQMKNKYYSVYNFLLRQIIDNEEVSIFGSGEQKRDLMYIDDTIDACIQALLSKNSLGNIYNISSNTGVALIEFVKEAIEISKTGSLKNVSFPDTWKGFETGDYIGSRELFEKDTGWSPKISLKDGLEKTIEYYKKHKKHYW